MLFVKDFDIEKVLNSGQTFVWIKINDMWIRYADPFLTLKQEGNRLEILTGKIEDAINVLGLQDDMETIIGEINKDEIISRAIEFGRGLRVVADGKWISTISFLLSIQSNIPLIKARMLKLAIKFGRKYNWNGNSIFLFPSPSEINIRKISKSDFGFRYKYIVSAIKEFRKGERLDKIMGIGPKVMDCIRLYGLHELNAFPVDVWIARAIKKFYPKFYDRNPRKMRDNMKTYFGRFAGYAQLFLYYYIRNYTSTTK